jgi:hypothetical protein
MKGTIIDLIKLANQNPELTQAIIDLAAQYDFEFSDEVSDEALEGVAGGVAMYPLSTADAGICLAFPDVCKTPIIGLGVQVPTPYPNIATVTGDDGTSTKVPPATKG